jgi:hypothetical protein
MLWSLLLPLALHLAPFAPQLDFGVLPAANAAAPYRFAVTITVSGKPPCVLPFRIGRLAAPADVADLLTDSLESPPWVLDRQGLVVTIRACGNAKVTAVTVAGDGPKPVVRWVLLPPKN